MADYTPDQLVEKVLAVRDKIAEIEARHKEELAPYKEAEVRLEAALLNVLNTQNAESMRCKAGTFFKSKKTKATVGDWPALLAHIKELDLYDLLTRGVNKTAVETYKEQHGELPPGVNWYEEVSVNVRRK